MLSLKKSQLTKIKNFTINFGPQHPAAHGVLRLILELKGETVKKADPHIGLLHRGTEKLIETKTYIQGMPYFNRLDYVSMMSQEHTYILALERLLNVQVNSRVKYIRVLFAEITRILNHLLAIGCHAMDVGAMTPFLWAFEEREKLMEFYEQVSGARMHSAYFRIGQVAKELPETFLLQLYLFCKSFIIRLNEISEMLDSNRIWKQRLVDIGIVPLSLAEQFGFSGVMLRGSGLAWDLRKKQSYDSYSNLDFKVITGSSGDCYSRYLVRLYEMYESVSIIEQSINFLADAPLQESVLNKTFLPSRFKMKQSMEDLIQHFKYFSDNVSLGDSIQKDFYLATEAPKGEFGVYLYALKDLKNLYRCKIKSPGYMHLQSLNEMSKGHLIADVVTIIGTQDIVFGEIDR